MKQEELAEKNLDLFHEFMMYVLEKPDILDRIPKGAQLVILPEDDPELCQKNLEIVRKRKEEGQTVVTVKMLTPKRVVPKIAVS
ncbi:hypothetical protein ISS37_00215 [candidate division KSB1 bacterium]|nr:hypothetical protein [candidate division KSB1 bacterium]